MKPKHLKYLREVAERVIDKYEEAFFEDPDGTCSPRFARHEALGEIDNYLKNLSIGAAPRPKRRKAITAKIRLTHDGTDCREVIVCIGGLEFTSLALEKAEARDIIDAVREFLRRDQ